MQLAVESRLGPYKVLSLIGSGAMGEVYRARDTRLRRDVAIKILQTIRSGDAGRERFEHEARAASGLNHPNILTIHDTGHEDGLAYIVMELIEGESLRKILELGAMPLRKALDIAIQMADGLAAAHDAGIVHRDLKPENIMITRDGRVKILDFGLAKEIGDDAVSEAEIAFANNETAPGMVIGTTAYMSPEQAKSRPVNFYSDQFALGLILFEMVTGRQAFRRATPLLTLSAIVIDDPPELDRGSVALRWLVRRCLHKDPEHRYSSTSNLLRELQNIRDHLTDTNDGRITEAPVPPSEPQLTIHKRANWLWGAAGLLCAGVVLVYVLSRSSRRESTVWADAQFTPFSREAALEVMPAWSPDGRIMAYAAERNGVFQIAVKSRAAASPVWLTNSSSDCFFPFWSPDGARIYYSLRKSGAWSLWSVGATGGSPEFIVQNAVQGAVAPNGKTLAFLREIDKQGLYAMWMGPLATKDFRRYDRGGLKGKAFLASSYLRFARDGQLGAWFSLASRGAEFWLIPEGDRQPEQRLEKLSLSPVANEFSWLPDSRSIIFSDPYGLSLHSHLYQAEIATGNLDQISNGAGSELSPAVSADGLTIAFSATTVDYDVVTIGVDGSVSPLIQTSAFEVSPAAAGDQIAYTTDRTGRPEIWLRTRENTAEQPIVTAESFGRDETISLLDVSFAPDATRIAYDRVSSDHEAIWISTIAGGVPVRLVKEPDNVLQRGPSWSPDGNQIVYSSFRNGQTALMRARVGGSGPPVQIATNAGVYPHWSPRGDWIATVGPGDGITLVSPDGAARRHLGHGSWLIYGWTGDGNKIIGVTNSEDRRLRVISMNVETGSESQLAEIGLIPPAFGYASALGVLPLQGFTISADGRSFVTSVIRAAVDVWLIERKR